VFLPGRADDNWVHDNIAAAELLPAIVLCGDYGIAGVD
jgi:hypothetical protein